MLYPQTNCFPLYFCKIITCLTVDQLSIGHSFSGSCKTVYQWDMKNCCFMSNMAYDPSMCLIIK